jgi:NAD-reducing hydrogenase small subunit
MSLLDIDERLIALADQVDIVYGPLVDIKTFPLDVDITLIEGAVSNRDDWEHVVNIRKNTKTLVSLGDCAVTGNVPAMRNAFGLADVMQRGYMENVSHTPQIPEHEDLPALIGRVRPVHEVVHVDVFVPGCPPPADAIFFTLTELLAGNTPDINAYTRFGK